jgi:hypothetical protein
LPPTAFELIRVSSQHRLAPMGREAHSLSRGRWWSATALPATCFTLALAACGGSPHPAAAHHITTVAPAAPAPAPTTATAPALVSSTTSAASPVVAVPDGGRATTTGTVALQTPTGGEILSPSGNISCEIDYGHAGLHQVYCQTVLPPRSVTMSVSGRLTKCVGRNCLGNPAVDTPTLAYGRSTGTGPFRCLSAKRGITCTVAGRGFRISSSGITTVSKL